jgi:hypothetical protein
LEAAMGANKLRWDLVQGQSRFEAWRGLRKVGSRIPQSLWKLAVRLAHTHGVSRTALALRIDYYGLKKRVAAADESPSNGPAFVELPGPLVAGKQCLFELHNGAGVIRRLQLVGYEAADVQTLACSFWNAE